LRQLRDRTLEVGVEHFLKLEIRPRFADTRALDQPFSGLLVSAATRLCKPVKPLNVHLKVATGARRVRNALQATARFRSNRSQQIVIECAHPTSQATDGYAKVVQRVPVSVDPEVFGLFAKASK
jgi:environmental stress-induced protein Ves